MINLKKLDVHQMTCNLFRALLHTNDRDPESSAFELDEDRDGTQSRPIRAFLSTISGKSIPENEPLTIQQQSYIDYIKQEIGRYPAELFIDIFNGREQMEQHAVDTDEIIILLKCLAESAQIGRGFSIDDALQQAVKNNILSRDTLAGPLHNQALSIIFSCVAWVSMLYPPDLSAGSLLFDTIAVDSSQCICISHSQPITNTNRPLCEVIQDFGPLLPVRRGSVIPNTPDSIFSAESLYVSLLNTSTLTQIGGIEIEWVNHVSSHLSFDPETQKLLLFALPSFCKVNEDQGSSFAKIVSSYYDEYNMPEGFSGSAFLKEVRRSYPTTNENDFSGEALWTLTCMSYAKLLNTEEQTIEVLTAKQPTFQY
ncbi:hypothetical protein VE03_08557 [Pseudogymnoascus sp. 23342-1-I1]|nr:hypothetical protein VE03_08557 [Pseudogymnoascus sp. 23342-1-I1]